MEWVVGFSIFGIRLVGVTAETGQKLLLTLLFLLLLLVVRSLLRFATRLVWRTSQSERARFWARQGVSLTLAIMLVLGVLSIWFNDPNRLALALGLVTAGLVFALQKVVTSLAGYFVILRGSTFNVGDRIVMGNVRGDVVALGFIQTTILEMGQPSSVQSADPAMWVRSRQYTGRIVTVTNDKIFDEPVYNYTRDFPYLWEEIPVPITYQADRARAEEILLRTAQRHTAHLSEISTEAQAVMRKRYAIDLADPTPRVYYRITDNWLELTVRFLVADHAIREVKDQMSRDLLREFDAAGIPIASTTYDIVGFPPLRLRRARTADSATGQHIWEGEKS